MQEIPLPNINGILFYLIAGLARILAAAFACVPTLIMLQNV